MTIEQMPPRDVVVRATPREFVITTDDSTQTFTGLRLMVPEDRADAPPTLAGHFAVFNQWTEINSSYEGRFMERIAPGAFAYAFRTNPQMIRVLFQHGRDPQIGDKPLGIPSMLEEDEYGARYEVPLFDTSYNRDLIPGIEAGAYGASFRFQVQKQDLDMKPKKSDTNPEGLPERTVQELALYEFGPVTFPAYSGATAGLRSLSDEWLRARLGITEITSQSALGPADTQSSVTTSGAVVTVKAASAAPHLSEKDWREWLNSSQS